VLHQEGYKVEAILGGRSEEYVIFKKEMEAVCDKVYYATDDGTLGKKGLCDRCIERSIGK
jgi:sulfide dehydrogenase (flavoprotein) subunit SudB (EC 1.97.-.-)